MAEFVTRYATALAQVIDASKLPAADVQSQLADFADTLAGPLRRKLCRMYRRH